MLDLLIKGGLIICGGPSPPGTWSTVSEYLAMFDRKVAVNIAYIVGNSPLRIGAVGWTTRPIATRIPTSW